MGVSAADYVGVLIFLEGSSQSVCQSGAALGGTRPGSRVVFLCGEPFDRTVRSNARLAEAVIIHEMLHSLGLGENPPSSQEITSRVLKSAAAELDRNPDRTRAVTRPSGWEASRPPYNKPHRLARLVLEEVCMERVLGRYSGDLRPYAPGGRTAVRLPGAQKLFGVLGGVDKAGATVPLGSLMGAAV